MPERGNLSAAGCIVTHNGVVTNNAISYMDGYRQRISAFNNVGRFIPGMYRSNPVVLERVVSFVTPGANTGEDQYLGNKGRISGSVHPAIINACSWAPLSANYQSFFSWDSTLAGYSLQKAYAKMNSPDLDVGVYLGELRETIGGLVNPFGAIKKYINEANRMFRLHSVPDASTTLNMLTGSWLEWWYGIAPTIGMIEDIIEHINAKSIVFDGKLFRKGGKVVKEKFLITQEIGTSPQCYTITGDVRIEGAVEYHSKLYYKLLRPLTFAERYGLNFSSIPSTAWELMRLSFVWDWFFGIGTWLNSMRTSNARSVVGSVTSQKSTVIATPRVRSVKFYNKQPAMYIPGDMQVVYERLDRRLNQPQAIGPVGNDIMLSLKRQVDAISLLWQALPKLKHRRR